MTDHIRLRSAFVPHDLEGPVGGCAERAACRPYGSSQGYVRYRRNADGRRKPVMVGGATSGRSARQRRAAHLAAGATIIGKTVCDEFSTVSAA